MVKRFMAPGPWITRDLKECVLASDYDALAARLAEVERERDRLRGYWLRVLSSDGDGIVFDFEELKRILIECATDSAPDQPSDVAPESESARPCTCHPDDNPPVPCPQKYALSECRKVDDEIERLQLEFATCEVDRDRYAREANKLEARLAEAEATNRHRDRQIAAIVTWLEQNQLDVFRRGLWDVIPRATDSAGEKP